MDVAWSDLVSVPTERSMHHFGKKLWTLFYCLIANGCSLAWDLQRAKKELCLETWQNVVATFVYFAASGCSLAWALQRAKKELRLASWQKIVDIFLCFDCQWVQLGLGFETGQERALFGTLAKSCEHFFIF